MGTLARDTEALLKEFSSCSRAVNRVVKGQVGQIYLYKYGLLCSAGEDWTSYKAFNYSEIMNMNRDVMMFLCRFPIEA